MLGRVADFKLLFKDLIQQGLPSFWDEQDLCISENEYQTRLLEKRNDTSRINQVVPSIKGQDIFDVLERDLFLFHETKQIILLDFK